MKILVATDGSDNALRAVQFLIGILPQLKDPARVTVLSVHDDAALRHAERFVGRATVADYLRELSENDLASARKALDDAGVQHDMVIRTGHVASEIVAAAAEGGFDVLVLGSKGRSQVRDLLMGSVAHRVVAMSKVPVLLVP